MSFTSRASSFRMKPSFCGSKCWYEGFQKLQVDTYNADNDNSLIDAYTKRPKNMEELTLIDVA